jgi:cyanate permease
MMQRRLCSAILLLEAIVLGLSTPVLISVESVDTARALWIGLGLTVACLVTAGLLRRTWAYPVGWAIQGAAVVLGFEIGAMFALGLGRTIDRDRAAAASGDQ